MAKKKQANTSGDRPIVPVADYRHPEATRKNNPPAKIAAEGYVPLIPKAEYVYSPHALQNFALILLVAPTSCPNCWRMHWSGN